MKRYQVDLYFYKGPVYSREVHVQAKCQAHVLVLKSARSEGFNERLKKYNVREMPYTNNGPGDSATWGSLIIDPAATESGPTQDEIDARAEELAEFYPGVVLSQLWLTYEDTDLDNMLGKVFYPTRNESANDALETLRNAYKRCAEQSAKEELESRHADLLR